MALTAVSSAARRPFVVDSRVAAVCSRLACFASTAAVEPDRRSSSKFRPSRAVTRRCNWPRELLQDGSASQIGLASSAVTTGPTQLEASRGI